MYRNRYEELLALVEKEKPRRILEVGTWNGHRAIQMCRWGAEYVGFDLFEDANDTTDWTEKNVKKHNQAQTVSNLLREFHIRHTLIKGNTRETLASYYGEVDFAFIDGGHSVETIASDWFHVQRIVKRGLVVFDDWYEGIDTSQWGANSIVNVLNEVTFSQCADPIVGGGYTRLAWVRV